MSVPGLVYCIAVLLFQLLGTYTVSSTPACPAPCLCEKTLLNCTILGLSRVPSQITATATALDLSHNALGSLAPLGSGRVQLRVLQHFWVGNNSLQNLSLCLGKGSEGMRTLTSRKERCVSWAPNLQLLSAERNQLNSLPRGLHSVKSLQVLQLSYNKISELGPTDLAGCTNLSKLYLQHNLINTIHPEAFKYLQKLQVLDLSYNLLTTVPMPAYLSLRNMNTLVGISGNRWRCDCNLKTLRRWLSFNHELGNPTWNMICFSPFHHAGKDLLHLEESDLTCPQPVYSTPSISKDMTVNEGMDLLLSCASADQDFIQSRWWTPQGQITESQQFLLISNVTEQHAGLYVCVSGFHEEHVSVFNLHVQKIIDPRLRREVFNEITEEENLNTQRNVPALRQVSQSRFALAVCLSVFITFIVAFVLGVLLRPLLDKCCIKIRTKKNCTSSSTSRTSSNEPRPYVNEGYSDAEDQEVQVGSRVRFGAVTEIAIEQGVQYYVTVEDPSSDSLSNGNMEVEVHKDVPLKVENKDISTSEYQTAETHEDIDSEHFKDIKDSENTAEEEERSISSASSCSDEHQELTSHEVKEFIEQNVDSSSVSTHEDDQASSYQKATILEFTSDTFSGIPKFKEESVDELDPDLWNDSGESFSFTEGSPRSSSRLSQTAGQDDLLMRKEMNVDKPSDEQYSCNSSESGESEVRSSKYIVNPEDEEPETNYDIYYSKNRLPDVDQDIVAEELYTGTGQYSCSSSESGESDGGPREYIVNPEEDNSDIYHKDDKQLDKDVIEKQYTGMDPLFRQDTITLDPSDIHMTFTRGDSFDDVLFTDYTKSSDPSDFTSNYKDDPKQYHVHPVYRTSQNTSSILQSDRSETSSCSEDGNEQDDDYPRKLVIKTEHEGSTTYDEAIPLTNPERVLNINYDNSSSSTDKEEKSSKESESGIFRGLSAKLFNRSGTETNKPVQPKTKRANTDTKSLMASLGLYFKRQPDRPTEEVKPTTEEDDFFLTLPESYDGLPKLKKYLWFSVCEPPDSEEIPTTEKSMVSSSTEDSFFGNIDGPVPQVTRYLQFSKSESFIPTQASSQVSAKEDVFHEVKEESESKEHNSSSEEDINATIKRDDFFSQIDASFDALPKVKKYLHFIPSESHLSSLSSLPTSIEKVEIPKFESRPSTDTNKISVFFKGSCVSLDSLPKVQRYIHFTQPQTSAQSHSTPTKPTMVPELTTTPPIQRSDSLVMHELSPPVKTENFFGDIGSAIDDLPKVNRYIEFTPSDIPTQTLHLGTEVKRNDTSVKYKPVAHHNFFEKIGASFDGLPKITRYIQFARPVSPPPSQSIHRPVVKPNKDNFFERIGASLCEAPKVKRYIHFTQCDSSTTSKSVNTHEVKSEIRDTPEFWRPVVDVRPPVTEDNFFEQIGKSFYSLPKVNKYIQFTLSSPDVLWQSQPPVSLKQTETSEINFFKEISASFHNLPRVKRYIRFSQLEVYSPAQSSVNINEGIIVDSVRPNVSSENAIEREHFMWQRASSFKGVPKVKRYIQFSQSHKHPSTQPSDSTQWVTESRRPSELPKEEIKPAIKEDNFFEIAGLSVTNAPKVKRYLMFTQAQPPSFKAQITPELVTPTESRPSSSSQEISKGETFFGQINTSVYEVPKIKRYIQFVKSEYQPAESAATTDARISDSSSINDIGAGTEEDNFIWQRASSFHGVPKVKRYIQFSQSDVYPSTQPSSDSTQWVTELKEPREWPKDEIKPATKEENFFEIVGLSVTNTPKVKRYLKFTQAQPASFKAQITPELVTPTESRPSSSSQELSKGETFFGQINASVYEVPKIKRYIQFIKSEYQPAESAATTDARILDSSSINDIGASTEDNFIWQRASSFHGVPKVKRYIQFSQSEVYPSTQPSSDSTQWVTELKEPRESPKEVIKPANKEDNFFEIAGLSVTNTPKVKRYLKFTQAQPPSFKAQITPELVTPTESRPSSSSQGISKGETFFRQINTSVYEVPKIKRYIQFIKSEYQPAESAATTDARISDSSSINDIGAGTEEDNFIWQRASSFHGVPKVKRYIQFSQSEVYPSTQPSSDSTQWVTESRNPSNSPKDEIKPATKEDNFFEIVGLSMTNTPKVKRYLKFTQAQPPSFKAQITPELVTPTESRPSSSSQEISKGETFFGQIDSYVYEVPEIKRYIQFSQSEVYPSTQPSSDSTQWVTESKEPREIKTATRGDNFFENLGPSVNTMPKLKRYILFTQLQVSTQSPSPSLKTEITPELQTPLKARPGSLSEEKLNPILKEDIFPGQTDTFRVPKVKRYIQFIKSEPQPSVQSPSTSLNREWVTTELATKTEAPRSDYFPEDGISKNVLWQLDIPLNGVPKVKRYIKFSELYSPLSRQKVKDSEDDKPPYRGSSFFESVGPSTNGQIDTSLGVPRVKRFIQFRRSEPQSSVQSSLMSPVRVTPELPTSIQSKRSEELGATTKRDNFFEDIGTSFIEIPKVMRYIEFTQREPFMPPYPFFPKQEVPVLSTDVKTKTSSFEELSQITDDEHYTFGQTSASFHRLPKVRRYLEFTQTTSQTSALPLPSVTGTPELLTNTDSWRSHSSLTKAHENTFFDKVDLTVHDIPKVKRYIQFTMCESHPSVHSKSGPVTATKLGFWRPSLPKGHVKPTMTEDDFFGQIETRLSSLPKVKRYIQFSQFNPNSLYQSQSKYSPKHTIMTEDNLIEGLSVSLVKIPKVRKSLQFVQSEPQPSNQTPSPSFNSKKVIPQLVMKTDPDCSSSKSDIKDKPDTNQYNVFGQSDTLLNGVPKVNKYIKFSQSNVHTPTQPSSVHFEGDIITESKRYSSSSMDDKPKPSEGPSMNRIPRLQGYVKFTQSDVTDHSRPPSLKTERLRPELKTKTEYTLTDYSSQKELSTISKADHFSRQMDEPYSQTLSPLMSNKPETTNAETANAYTHFAQRFTTEETEFGQTRSNSLYDYKKGIITQESSSKTQEFKTKWSGLGTSASDDISPAKTSLHFSTPKEIFEPDGDSRPLPKPRSHLSLNFQNIPDIDQSISDPALGSPGQDDAKDYLRDSSIARQRQERRRLMFQQKRRAMDGLTSSPQSLPSHEDDQPSISSVHQRVPIQSNSEQRVSTVTANYRGVDLAKYESQGTKLSSLRTKATMHHGAVKRSDV